MKIAAKMIIPTTRESYHNICVNNHNVILLPCHAALRGGARLLITDLLRHLLCALSYGAASTAVHCSCPTNAEFITMSFVCATAPPTKYDGKGLTSEPYKPLRIGFIRQRRQG